VRVRKRAFVGRRSVSKWRSFLVLVLAVALGGELAGCSSSGGSSSITLFNGQHPQTTDALVSTFEQQTGIHVSVDSNDEDLLATQIINEGSHSPADVILTENSQPLEHLEEAGLLSHVDPATLARTPRRYDSPAGDWVGVSARVSVIVYNPSLIRRSQLPTRVLQLAQGAYAGKLAIAPGETDFQPIVTSVERAYGRAATLHWLEGIKANGAAHSYPDNETITYEVNRGAVAFGIVNQ
jgi:iron(III) transport system substrate-binding protein